MRKAYLSLIICLLIAQFGSLYPADGNFSERLGNNIDLWDRTYYMLFPTIGDFVKAVARPRSDNSCEFVITRMAKGVQSDTLLVLSMIEASAMRDYIDNFEKYSNKEYFENNLTSFGKISERYVWLDENYTEGKQLNLKLMNGNKIEGRLLVIDNELLVIWTNNEMYDFRNLEKYAVAIHYSEMDEIENFSGISVKGSSAAFKKLESKLSDHGEFQKQLSKMPFYYPKEMKTFIERKKNLIKGTSITEIESLEEIEKLYHKEFYVSLNFPTTSMNFGEMLTHLVINPTSDRIVSKPIKAESMQKPVIDLSCVYMMASFNIGIEFLYSPAPSVDSNGIWANGQTFGAFIEFYLKRYDPYFFDLPGRIELSFIGGLFYEYIDIETRFSPTFADSYNGTIDYSIKSNSIGLIAGSVARFYIFRNFAFHVKGEVRYNPSIKYGDYRYLSKDKNFWEKEEDYNHIIGTKFSATQAGLWFGLSYAF